MGRWQSGFADLGFDNLIEVVQGVTVCFEETFCQAGSWFEVGFGFIGLFCSSGGIFSDLPKRIRVRLDIGEEFVLKFVGGLVCQECGFFK